jgi:4'-phosphopantetheinyl transferase
MPDRLTPDRVDVWYTLCEEADSPARLARYREILEESERDQADRFVFERDRIQYAIARALLRTTLSRYAAIDPQAWRFAKNRYGRPEIDIADLDLPLRFNLTHTRGLVACAVVLEHDIGIDAENVTRQDVGPAVADRFFSPLEVAALGRLPDGERRRAFFAYWTLKEAYIKARGMGLSLPLDQFSLHLGQPIGVSFAAQLADRPEDWQFEQFRLGECHLLAVAVKRPGKPNLHVQTRKVVPLDEDLC